MNFKFTKQWETVGKQVEINGAKIYYEEYGKGEPLLIHGNGGSIESMGNQIDYFKTKYRVVIADNRGKVNLNWKQILWHMLKSLEIGMV
jgi:hypothetical protein